MSELADVTFNSPGPWDKTNVMGPAMSIPQIFLDLKLTEKLWVEFLRVGRFKNHLVFRAIFDTLQSVHGKNYFGVRISMDVAKKAFEVLNDEETDYYYDEATISGEHYHPGQMSIKFLDYSSASISQEKTLGFDIIKSDLTLGQLIRIAMDTKIHKFVFLPYRQNSLEIWKGCRDFILQFWLLLVENGFIMDKDDDGVSLIDVIAFFYPRGNGRRPQPVDKGDWPTPFVRVEAKDKVGNVYEPLA